jgi:hypothetical protein
MNETSETTAGPEEKVVITYSGSRFPWWITLIWASFFLFAFIYMSRFFFPDLARWLRHPVANASRPFQ